MNQQTNELIGAIVLEAQSAEKWLKAILPFSESQCSSLGDALSQHTKNKKRTLGSLVRGFAESATSEEDDFEQHLAHLVECRNQIVHHFGETYGEQLRSGQSKEVVDSLRTLLANIKVFRIALQQIALLLFEAMRDTTFIDTPEYKNMDKLCSELRRLTPSN